MSCSVRSTHEGKHETFGISSILRLRGVDAFVLSLLHKQQMRYEKWRWLLWGRSLSIVLGFTLRRESVVLRAPGTSLSCSGWVKPGYTRLGPGLPSQSRPVKVKPWHTGVAPDLPSQYWPKWVKPGYTGVAPGLLWPVWVTPGYTGVAPGLSSWPGMVPENVLSLDWGKLRTHTACI